MKPKNSRARGNRFEKKIEAFLKGLGWIVETAHPKLMFIGPGRTISASHDIYGCFDHICIHRDMQNVLMIQASISPSLANAKKKKIDELIGPRELPNWSHFIQVWLRDEKARNRIIVLQRNNSGAWIESSFRMEEGVWPTHILGQEPNVPHCPI